MAGKSIKNKKHEWYRSRTWDEADRVAFNTKIRRTRAGYNRAQYFWLKAGALFYARPAQRALREAAVQLLQRSLVEAEAEGRDRGSLLDNLARYQMILGQHEAAEASLRECFECGGPGSIQTPPTKLLLARCLAERGQRDEAIALYDEAYSGKVSYESLVDREIVDASGAPYRDPDDAAEAIVVYFHALDEVEGGVPEVFDANLASLAAIDRVFRIENDLKRPHAPRQYKTEFRDEHLIPELGAYVGRVLCKVGGGTWRAKAPLMKSRVVLGTREVDPFRIAYEAAYYEFLLEPAARELLATATRGTRRGR